VSRHTPNHLRLEGLVTAAAGRGRPGLGGVVGGRGDLQRLAGRLDPEPAPVSVDERHYFFGRPSSSVAKKTDAAFSISLARRSSRFSRSS
jgi:hypothetical protein